MAKRRSGSRPTLRDVAAQAGVSLGTASIALNGSDRVRPETRARVEAAAQRLAYMPDPNAVRLLRGRTGCVAIVYTGGTNPGIDASAFYSIIVRGATETLQRDGYTMRLVAWDPDGEPHGQPAIPAAAFDADGLIILNYQLGGLVETLAARGLPIVVADSSGGYPQIASVDNDDRGGVAIGVRHLLELGHRHIALLNPPLLQPFGQQVLAGYLQAHEEADVPVRPQLLCTSRVGIATGQAATAELLARDIPVTAIMAATDDLALGAMRAVEDRGLRVPDDISIVGMDDVPLATAIRPPLTTVRIDMPEIGRRAAELLTDTINGAKSTVDHIILPTELVIRATTAKPSHTATSK